jgi:hypothetical protein
MMRWIVSSSLKFRFLVVPVASAMMFLGVTQVPGGVGGQSSQLRGRP